MESSLYGGELKNWTGDKAAGSWSGIEGVEPPLLVVILSVFDEGEEAVMAVCCSSWGVPLRNIDGMKDGDEQEAIARCDVGAL